MTAPDEKPAEPSKLWLRVEDVARELDVSITTARAWVKQMKHVRNGRVVRVHRTTLEKWKAAHTCGEEQNSGSGSGPTGAPGRSTGRTSGANGSRRSAPRSKPQSAGRKRENWNEPILVAQPRKPPPSKTP